MKKKIIVIAAATLVAFGILSTCASAEMTRQKSPTLKSIMQETRFMLNPVLEHNLVKITDKIPDNFTIAQDRESLKEKLLTLFMNAIVHAPKGADIRAELDRAGKTISLWVENKSIKYGMKREIVDNAGNSYNIELIPNSGARYSLALVP